MATMTTEERQRFEAMEKGMEKIQTDIQLIKLALLGNELGGDTGLIGKLGVIEGKQNSLEQEVRLLRDEKVRNAVYIKIIVWLLMIIGTICIGYIVNTALGNKNQVQGQQQQNVTKIVPQ